MSVAEFAAIAPSIRPGSLRAWILAARPATLTVAVVPVLVGTAVVMAQHARVPWPVALAALFGAIFIQIGTNLANDVFDYEKGADTAERLGPTRATQAGLLTPAQTRAGMIVSFGLATCVGAYLTHAAGSPIVVIGVLSIASGIAYTGGPWPLGYNGLGDLFVLIFFGFVAVCGTVYVEMLRVPLLAWVAAVPVGALATAVLVVNNVRDAEQDRLVGKRTLVVRFGRFFGIVEYALLLVAAAVVPFMLLVLQLCSPYALLPLLTAPLGVHLAQVVATRSGSVLNGALARTAQLLLLYGVLFSIGLVLD